MNGYFIRAGRETIIKARKRETSIDFCFVR